MFIAAATAPKGPGIGVHHPDGLIWEAPLALKYCHHAAVHLFGVWPSAHILLEALLDEKI